MHRDSSFGPGAIYTEADPQPVIFLIAMKELLSYPDRWTQGTTRSGDAFCVAGATWEVGVKMSGYETLDDNGNISPDTDRSYLPETCWFVREAVRAHDPSYATVWEWNDAPERTHDDVMAVLDTAIDLCMADLSLPMVA